MNQPFSNSPLLNQINPQEEQIINNFPDPNTYKLNQSYFNRDELFGETNFEIILKPDYLYFGGIYKGLKHGWGVLITKNTVFEGKFSLNHKMGKGYLKFANGSIYLGDFTNDKPHGQGLLQFNSQYYIGDFENGAMQGDGLWRNKQGDKYVGQWRSNKAHGFGIYVTQQSHYQGQFAQFVKQGYGIQNFQNGDTYKGTYLQGKPHGMGQYVWAKGGHYKGEFLQGFRQGEGAWTSQNGDKYTGHFSGDRKNGQGEYFWINGNQYRGQFCQDMREGQGEMIWNDGSIYEGQWQRGLPNGKGIFKVKGEKPRIGFFEDNVLIKQIKNSGLFNSANTSLRNNNHDSSLILAMIPQMTRRKNFAQSESKNKVKKRQTQISTNNTTSFMSTSKNRTWRSRMK